MSNSYHSQQTWGQPRMGYVPQQGLQLEQEIEASAYLGVPRQRQHPQQNSTIFAAPYQFGNSQSPQNHGIAASSSSLHGAFNTNNNSHNSSNPRAVPHPLAAMTSHSSQSHMLNINGNGGFNNPSAFSYPNPIAPAAPITNGLGTDGGVLSASRMSSSPAPMQEYTSSPPSGSQRPSSYYFSQQSSDPALPQAKRARGHFTESADEDHDGDMNAEPKEGTKVKAPGACARCKGLKVKCEFRTDTDACKRCFNGGHECVIPGRKKRRTPPKREHLLAQIREQAVEIQKLMAQLEATNSTSSNRASASAHSDISSPPLHSPVLSPSSTSGSYFSVDSHSFSESPAESRETNKAVEDWIAKAKESLQEFGSFIGVGGAGLPRNLVMGEDLEESESSGEEEYVHVQEDESGEYGVIVEDPDGEDSTYDSVVPSRKIRHVGTGPSHSDNSDQEDDKGAGIANANFFTTTPPAPDQLARRLHNTQPQIPHILARNIITPAEAEKLFQIYFDNMNLSVSLLDPVLYTAQRTFYRSPFLFTVVCAIASRFYSDRPELYPQAMHYAQLAAGTALISGHKNVEMCQAYILLSLYPVPTRKWEDQRSWLYLGLAIRTATDLNLHLPTTAKPLNENHAREMLNRTRVWLNCFNLDRSTGSQYGKPPIISGSDYMANHSQEWWNSSPYNMTNFDIHTSAYNSELKVMGRFISKIYSDPEHPTGLNKEVDFEAVATEADEEFKKLWEYWSSVLQKTDLSDPQNSFRTGLLSLAYSYARLIALSYGFQHAFGKNDGMDENPFLMRCFKAASDVVHAVVDDICRPSQLHYWRHGPEAQSVFVTFASAFLVKLLQPKFAAYLSIEQRVEIRGLVQKVVDLLGSAEIAIDERHGPKLYSRFLKNLLAAPMARTDPMSPGALSGASLPRQRSRAQKSTSGQTPVQSPEAARDSLSPPPNQAILSFDTFAPMGATDPYAHEVNGTSSINDLNGLGINFFQPELPQYDNDIMQSMQSLADPSTWSDMNMPLQGNQSTPSHFVNQLTTSKIIGLTGFNWMPQLQQNLDLSLPNPTR
ncbi:hypothetical protein BDQ17DRAFT_1436191 [Cyathus striatus]|nr:hypothetical protein BDQ17DRAFT_1436191 [Cyathus striatus]